jgi:hypothetical protein
VSGDKRRQVGKFGHGLVDGQLIIVDNLLLDGLRAPGCSWVNWG